jgi:hypothetical protein
VLENAEVWLAGSENRRACQQCREILDHNGFLTGLGFPADEGNGGWRAEFGFSVRLLDRIRHSC